MSFFFFLNGIFRAVLCRSVGAYCSTVRDGDLRKKKDRENDRLNGHVALESHGVIRLL